MTCFRSHGFTRVRQAGLTLIELMVSIAISATVLAGVVSVLVASKSNFVNQRELSGIQENARFAIKYMSDEIRMAANQGGCRVATYGTNQINNGTTSWYLSWPGLQGYEYDAGINTFPTDYKASVKTNTDSIVVRRGERTGLTVSHNGGTFTFTTTTAHGYVVGQPFVVTSYDCEYMGIFQMSGGTATTIIHGTGTASPGNCDTKLVGTAVATLRYFCTAGVAPASTANTTIQGPNLMELHSEAYYVGSSTSDSTVPALFRARVTASGSAATIVSEELVQGVENMQILYGIDLLTTGGAAGQDGLADKYVKADVINAGTGGAAWSKVVSVRISLRMRSISPIYNENTAYTTFEGVTGTDGSDRYMRQYAATTIRVRNL